MKHDIFAIVMNDGGANGCSVVYNLSKEGVPVITISHDKDNISFYSRSINRKIICPDWKDDSIEFILFLVKLGKEIGKKSALFATDDVGIEVITKFKEDLDKYFFIPADSYEKTSLFSNKKKFYKLLEKEKIAHAKTYYPENLNELETVSPNIKYPCLVKASNSKTFHDKFGKKFFFCHDYKELEENFETAKNEGEDFIIQEVMKGQERYLTYFYINQKGEVAAEYCFKKTRLNMPPYGTACLMETKWNEKAVKDSLEILKRVDYRGLAEPEVQIDQKDGQYKIQEINVRTCIETGLPRVCGTSIEYLAYCDFIGKKIIARKQIEGVKWWDILRDVEACFSSTGYISQQLITKKQFLKSIKGKKEFALFKWDDPLPFLIALFRYSKPYLNSRKISKILNLLR